MARNYKEGDTPIPGYKLLKFLGRGGFGEVWKAAAPGGFEVALKIINLSGKPGQKELRALQVVKQLRHSHLIQVTAFWLRDEEGNILPDPEQTLVREPTPEPTIQDTMTAPLEAMADMVHARPAELVIAMGLADQSLFDRLQECLRKGLPGIPVEELLGYMKDSAQAIDYLNSPRHSFMGSEPMAIQHCDIKPHNILIVSGGAHLCDFGLARVMGDVQNSSAAAGTIAYAAPECIKEGKPSSTTDQYSLALSYLELRTGSLPYDSETWMEVLTAVQQGNLNLSKLPSAEQVVIRRATAQNPGDRYPSATEMVRALREAAHQPPVELDHGKAEDKRSRMPLLVGLSEIKRSRMPLLVGVIALGVIALGVIGLGFLANITVSMVYAQSKIEEKVAPVPKPGAPEAKPEVEEEPSKVIDPLNVSGESETDQTGHPAAETINLGSAIDPLNVSGEWETDQTGHPAAEIIYLGSNWYIFKSVHLTRVFFYNNVRFSMVQDGKVQDEAFYSLATKRMIFASGGQWVKKQVHPSNSPESTPCSSSDCGEDLF